MELKVQCLHCNQDLPCVFSGGQGPMKNEYRNRYYKQELRPGDIPAPLTIRVEACVDCQERAARILALELAKEVENT